MGTTPDVLLSHAKSESVFYPQPFLSVWPLKCSGLLAWQIHGLSLALGRGNSWSRQDAQCCFQLPPHPPTGLPPQDCMFKALICVTLYGAL